MTEGAIVVQGLGWGNVNIPMYEAVQEAIAKKVVVIISTRVQNGRILAVYGFKGCGTAGREGLVVCSGTAALTGLNCFHVV